MVKCLNIVLEFTRIQPMIFATMSLLLTASGPLPNSPYKLEAARLTKGVISTFYDSKAKIWRPPVPSAESVGDQGYTFWPSLLAWQVIIEAAKADPKTWKSQIGRYYDTLEQYFSKKDHGYCAWIYFPGNDDLFYDDNTWAAVACMEAFEVTGEKRYRARAIEIFDKFVKDGWDEKAGGLRWGTKAGIEDRHDHTVSATAAGALAAMLIAPTRAPEADYLWAKKSLDWIKTKLSQENGLIQDGIKQDGRIMTTVWTYNTGVPIRAALEYAKQTGDKQARAWAVKMGDAAINRSYSPLYDGAVANMDKRYWYDGSYFVHYLVDGLRALSLATGNRKYLVESRRQADYMMSCLKDKDGLYWRSMRLWQINPERTEAFQKLTGSSQGFSPDSSERSQLESELAKPVEQRKMVKTLLGNVGAARMFWLLSH